METQRSFERRRPIRGVPYSLADFQKKYGLDEATAEDLFIRFGPSSIELDLLMAAKWRLFSFDDLTKEMLSRPTSRKKTNSSLGTGRNFNGRQRRQE